MQNEDFYSSDCEELDVDNVTITTIYNIRCWNLIKQSTEYFNVGIK